MMRRVLARLTSIPGVQGLWLKYPVGSVDLRIEFDVWSRPHYAYGTFSAAKQAVALGIKAISVIEFGVAGGNGLLALEDIAERIAKHFRIQISVFGFDTGEGMPPAKDYRDLPHVWEEGFYRMEQDKLKARLKSAKLLIGNIDHTIPQFLADTNEMPPIGFVAFDLDYYSSTISAFRIFSGDPARRLPRVYCYFDDIIWPEMSCQNEYVGELCAIRDFNAASDHQKICPVNLLRYMRRRQSLWNEMIYVLHDFKHPAYCVNLMPGGDAYRQMPL